MEEIKPNYFAVIPANVRYDNELTEKAKLLYGEITCLSNKEGISETAEKDLENKYSNQYIFFLYCLNM